MNCLFIYLISSSPQAFPAGLESPVRERTGAGICRWEGERGRYQHAGHSDSDRREDVAMECPLVWSCRNNVVYIYKDNGKNHSVYNPVDTQCTTQASRSMRRGLSNRTSHDLPWETHVEP